MATEETTTETATNPPHGEPGHKCEPQMTLFLPGPQVPRKSALVVAAPLVLAGGALITYLLFRRARRASRAE
jgi:hypothetical protein